MLTPAGNTITVNGLASATNNSDGVYLARSYYCREQQLGFWCSSSPGIRWLAYNIAFCFMAATLIFCPSAAHAADGQTDATFNAGGTGADDSVAKMAVQPDGKIIIAGLFRGYNGNSAVSDFLLRLNPDGTVDQTFNAGGIGPNHVISGIAIQPDGKILIGGHFTSYNGDEAASDRIMRLNADGTRDVTFNTGGAGVDASVDAIVIQPDGKILIAGFFTRYNGDASASDMVMRLNPDGSRDSTFNAGGSGANFGLLAIVAQPDGRILVGGLASFYNGNGAASNGIMRLHSDGTLDSTFNLGGAGANGRVSTLAVQPDSKIVIGGNFNAYNDDGAAPDGVMRLNSDGTRDLGFNPGGAGTGIVVSVVLQNGKILVGGALTFYNGDGSAPDHIIRLNADGTPDPTFNPGGVGANTPVYAIALQPDGKILIGGEFTAYNGDNATPDRLMRLLHGPEPQLRLDSSGPNPNQAAALDSLLLLRDPFPKQSIASWWNLGADRNTRVLVFAASISLNAGEPPSVVTVNLVDANNNSFDVVAEDVRVVPNSDAAQIRFRLPNADVVATGLCAVKVRKGSGPFSNPATFRIAP